MSTIHSSCDAARLEVGAERRQRQVQHRQVHRVEQAGQRDDGEADPLAPRGERSWGGGCHGLACEWKRRSPVRVVDADRVPTRVRAAAAVSCRR